MAQVDITKLKATEKGLSPIDLLDPVKYPERHGQLLQYLLDRLQYSERKMSQFYARWALREKQVQAYLDLPDYEKQLDALNKMKDAPPIAVSLIVPYTYATVSTIATYLIHTFTGRKPLFQVGSYNALGAQNAPNMETMLQYNSDVKYLLKRLVQFFKDGETYGMCAMRVLWCTEKKMRTSMGADAMGNPVKKRALTTTFEGSDVENVDPFMFFPDPRVPITEVAWKGEFCFWREFVSKMDLKKAEANGIYKFTSSVGQMPATSNSEGSSGSARGIRAFGDPNPGQDKDSRGNATGMQFVQKDQGTCEFIPADWGLGESKVPEKWLFTLGNKKQIIQAEKLEYDHDMHPVLTAEPHTMGYGFGNLSTADYLSPLQDAASWFLNSHIHNVRATLNNQLVVNPAMIEMKDLASPKPGKLIRMKRSAMGQDPRMAVMPLPVSDITRSHIGDLMSILKMGDMLSSVSDNLRGILDSGGRKTATEVRTSGEAAASRLAAQARLYSAQAISPLGNMMAMNFQQFLTGDYEMKILGQDKSIRLGPAELMGDYFFPIHDGTLPLDKVAMLDTWKEILMGVAQNPVLSSKFDLVKIFEWTAELGGARNIDAFKIVTLPQPAGGEQGAADQAGALEAAAAAGNIVPLPGGPPRVGAPPSATPLPGLAPIPVGAS